MGAPDSPVRQPRHPNIRVLTVSTIGALTAWAIGQLLFTVWCAFWRCSNSARTVHVVSRPLESTVVLATVAPLGIPDSPVNYSGVAMQKTRR
jgi:membrane protein YqaA with SNARE-associated domain